MTLEMSADEDAMNHGRSGPADPTGRTADCTVLSNPNLRFTLRMLEIRHISHVACAALPHGKYTGTINILQGGP